MLEAEDSKKQKSFKSQNLEFVYIKTRSLSRKERRISERC